MRSGQALTCAQPCPEHMKAFALLSRIGWLRGRIVPRLVQACWHSQGAPNRRRNDADAP